jgi:hypothetical protein
MARVSGTLPHELTYDQDYVLSKSAIPLPSRKNPAYEDYCRSQGISKDEDNLSVLLGTIGKRGAFQFYL